VVFKKVVRPYVFGTDPDAGVHTTLDANVEDVATRNDIISLVSLVSLTHALISTLTLVCYRGLGVAPVLFLDCHALAPKLGMPQSGLSVDADFPRTPFSQVFWVGPNDRGQF
jgi:hypothetical protein